MGGCVLQWVVVGQMATSGSHKLSGQFGRSSPDWPHLMHELAVLSILPPFF